MKKKLIVFCSCVLFWIVIFLLISYTTKDKLILKGYYSSNEYWDENGFQDYTDYCKYYYDNNFDELFKNSTDYQEITKENINNIISYFKDFEKLNKKEYDFNIEAITIGDYVHIKTKEGIKIGNGVYKKFDNYTVYLYDIETHSLIYIHNNI